MKLRPKPHMSQLGGEHKNKIAPESIPVRQAMKLSRRNRKSPFWRRRYRICETLHISKLPPRSPSMIQLLVDGGDLQSNPIQSSAPRSAWRYFPPWTGWVGGISRSCLHGPYITLRCNRACRLEDTTIDGVRNAAQHHRFVAGAATCTGGGAVPTRARAFALLGRYDPNTWTC
jgi:hypothetical protein